MEPLHTFVIKLICQTKYSRRSVSMGRLLCRFYQFYQIYLAYVHERCFLRLSFSTSASCGAALQFAGKYFGISSGIVIHASVNIYFLFLQNSSGSQRLQIDTSKEMKNNVCREIHLLTF